ncbi:MAG: sensor histidine kinase [Sarcina sp.]
MYIVLIGIVVYLSFRVIGIKSEIRSIEKQLSDNHASSKNIRVMGMSKEIKSLVIKINKKISDKDNIIIEHKNNEKKLKDAISNISHDIRTPLTSILGYIQIIQKNNGSDKHIAIIAKRSESLYKLVEEFFELSLIDSGNTPINIEKFNIENLLTNILISSYEQISKKNLELQVDIEPNEYNLYSDEGIVERILTNLMQNLIRYSNSYASIKLSREAKKTILIIANDGNTLSNAEVQNVFDRFYKVDKSRNSVGSGLGLAIVKELACKIDIKVFVRAIDNIIEFKLIFE